MQGTTDARLQTGKATVIANPTLYTDFETVVKYLTTLLDEEQSMAVATRSHQRNVSTMRINGGQHDGRHNGRAPRGGGTGGRFPGRGRNARGGQGGRHHAGRLTTSNITDRNYTKEEWIALLFEDKQKVQELRAKQNREFGTSEINTERNVVQKVSTIPNDVSTLNSRNMSISGITTTSTATGIGGQMSQRRTL
jgi:hypothetical protein